MTEIYDDIIVSLAALLGCDLKLVQKHFDDLNIARAPDVTESKRLVDDNKTLADLYKGLRHVNIALKALSSFEQQLLKIEHGDIHKQIKELETSVRSTLSHRRSLRTEFSNQGGGNVKAYLVAELVGHIFKHQNRKITYTKTSGTSTRAANEPSSDFAKCVQQALRITHTDGRPRTLVEDVKFIDFADWQNPTKHAVKLFRPSKK